VTGNGGVYVCEGFLFFFIYYIKNLVVFEEFWLPAIIV